MGFQCFFFGGGGGGGGGVRVFRVLIWFSVFLTGFLGILVFRV